MAVRVPPAVAAYDGLDQERRHRIENLTAIHDALARHAGRRTLQSDAVNLLERLRDRAGQYLLFTEDLHVAPTNNVAERDQRPVKTWIRISGSHAWRSRRRELADRALLRVQRGQAGHGGLRGDLPRHDRQPVDATDRPRRLTPPPPQR
ncbi:MAG: transposase [Streptomyces sp.]|nr:transposase [Streptomyces sp.]